MCNSKRKIFLLVGIILAIPGFIIAIVSGGIYIDAVIHFKSTQCLVLNYNQNPNACPDNGGGGGGGGNCIICILEKRTSDHGSHIQSRDNGNGKCIIPSWNVRITTLITRFLTLCNTEQK